MSEMSGEFMLIDTKNKKVIYDASKGSNVLKQKELWKKKFKMIKISIGITALFILLLILFSIYFIRGNIKFFETLYIIFAYSMAFLFLYIWYFISKYVFSAHTQNIILFEDGIFYEKPFSFKHCPNQLFIYFKEIKNVSLKQIDSENLISIKLKEKNKKIERFLLIWEDSVNDIEKVYNIISKQTNKILRKDVDNAS